MDDFISIYPFVYLSSISFYIFHSNFFLFLYLRYSLSYSEISLRSRNIFSFFFYRMDQKFYLRRSISKIHRLLFLYTNLFCLIIYFFSYLHREIINCELQITNCKITRLNDKFEKYREMD